MGLYTDLECEAIIKQAFQEKIHKRVFEPGKYNWKDLFNHEFTQYKQADFIPYGETVDVKPEDVYNGRILKIDCAIKSYKGELDLFFKFLNGISESIISFRTHCELDKEYNPITNESHYLWKNYITGNYEIISVKESF